MPLPKPLFFRSRGLTFRPPPYKTGLCFSVRSGVKIPPSLRNIYKEIKEEYPEFDVPKHGSVHVFDTAASDPAVVVEND